MKHFSNTFLGFLGGLLVLGISVTCGDKDEDKDKPKPALMTQAEQQDAQRAAIQEAVTNALPAQLLAPLPMQMGVNGYACTGQISMSYPDPDSDEDPFIVRYSHSCKAK